MAQYLDENGLTSLISKIKNSFATTEYVNDAIENSTYELPVATIDTLGGVKPDGTSITIDNGKISVSENLQNLIQNAVDALVFKGTIGVNGTISTLPNPHSAGWTYKVSDNETTLNGVKCELGDLIICITSGETANADHWTVVQSNIDGAVTSSSTISGDGYVAVFDGTTGKIIKDSSNVTAKTNSLEVERFLDVVGGLVVEDEASFKNTVVCSESVYFGGNLYGDKIIDDVNYLYIASPMYIDDNVDCYGDMYFYGSTYYGEDLPVTENNSKLATTGFVHAVIDDKMANIPTGVTFTGTMAADGFVPIFSGNTGNAITFSSTAKIQNLTVPGTATVSGILNASTLTVSGGALFNGSSQYHIDISLSSNNYEIANTKFVHDLLNDQITALTTEEIQEIFS